MKLTNSILRIRPYGIRLRPGHRLAIRIAGHDGEPPTHHLHGIGSGHVARQSSSRVTIYHDTDHPSHLLLPVTRGNRIGTFMSGAGQITTHESAQKITSARMCQITDA